MVAARRKNDPRIERKLARVSGVREAIGQGMGTIALIQKAINIKEQENRK